MLKKIIVFLLSAVMVISCAACGTSVVEKQGLSDSLLPAPELTVDFEVPDDFKIGMLCLHDENSTYDANFINALKTVGKLLNLTNEQILIKTDISESSACYDAATELVNAGCDIIFADSFGHESFVIQAAKDYPNVQFFHATGTQAHVVQLANFHNVFASIYEGRYLAGIVAGMKLNEMINAGTITAEEAVMGYVGAFTYAEVISGMTSFYLGAKSVCPSVTMKVRYTGSWYDQALEQEAATSLINTDHCVLISQHADSLGAPTACELAGVPNVSYNGSTYEAGESTFLISSAINWQPYFLYIIEQVCGGSTAELGYDWVGSIATGSVILTGMNLDTIADGTAEAVQTAIDGFKAGTLHVFDVSKDNYITVNDEKITEYMADIDGDYVGDTNVIHDGYFDESSIQFRAAPYFDILIDGITNINTNY